MRARCNRSSSKDSTGFTAPLTFALPNLLASFVMRTAISSRTAFSAGSVAAAAFSNIALTSTAVGRGSAFWYACVCRLNSTRSAASRISLFLWSRMAASSTLISAVMSSCCSSGNSSSQSVSFGLGRAANLLLMSPRMACSRSLMSRGVWATSCMPFSLFRLKLSRGVRIGVAPGPWRMGVAPTLPGWRKGVAIGFGVDRTCLLGAAPPKPVVPSSSIGVFSPPRSADCVSVLARAFRISLAMWSSSCGALGVRIGVLPTMLA